MTSNKRQVERSCAVCREHKGKNDLIRVVKAKDGKVSLDESGKMPGRGTYVCKNKECWRALENNNALEHGLRCAISSHDKSVIVAKAVELIGGMTL